MSTAAQTVKMPPAELVAVVPDRETVLYLRKQSLSKAQVRNAQRILNDAIDGLVDLDAFGAADLLIDLRNLLTR
ncbi:MAG TPA: hypothetical protein VGD78_15045 [Chthoniobacterales bacterium]